VLIGAPVISTATAPAMGAINTYNASSGALSVTLPALSSLNVGASCDVEKIAVDTTYNAITFTCNGADLFNNTASSTTLSIPGEMKTFQVISVNGTKFWQITAGLTIRNGITSLTSEFSLTNSSANTNVIITTLPSSLPALAAGTTYRVQLNGTVQTQATSGALTFTPIVQGAALTQTAVMATQTSANAASPFFLDYVITVRTTGTSGTVIAKPYGIINLATSGVVYLTSTSTGTTTVNTTPTASAFTLGVQAQWATASATNTLLVETATIERVL
jgi:hypothetical protein